MCFCLRGWGVGGLGLPLSEGIIEDLPLRIGAFENSPLALV